MFALLPTNWVNWYVALRVGVTTCPGDIDSFGRKTNRCPGNNTNRLKSPNALNP